MEYGSHGADDMEPIDQATPQLLFLTLFFVDTFFLYLLAAK